MHNLFAAIILAALCIARAANPSESDFNAAAECAEESPSGPIPTFADESLSEFSWALFGKARAAANGANVLLSPVSVALALQAVQAGAGGSTHSQLWERFHTRIVGAKLDWSPVASRRLIDAINNGSGDYELSAANAVYVNQSQKIAAEYSRVVRDCLDSEVSEIDFANAEAARKQINEWVESKTEHRIKDIVAEGTFNEATALALVNAIYFKAEWAKTFTKENGGSVHDSEFKPIDAERQSVTYMKRDGHYPYYEDDSLQVLGLPYKGDGGLAMYIILPKEESASVNEMDVSHKKINELLAAVKEEWVDVALPMFNMTETVDLKPLLMEMGITDMFDASRADLSGMVESKQGDPLLYVSDAVQKAFIKVDINGTEAGAATVVTVAYNSRGPDNVFQADHPFLFVVARDGVAGARGAPPKVALFHGIVNRV